MNTLRRKAEFDVFSLCLKNDPAKGYPSSFILAIQPHTKLDTWSLLTRIVKKTTQHCTHSRYGDDNVDDDNDDNE
jgi:hypothetical protein